MSNQPDREGNNQPTPVERLENVVEQQLNLTASELGYYKKKLKPIIMAVLLVTLVSVFFYFEFFREDENLTVRQISVIFNLFNKTL